MGTNFSTVLRNSGITTEIDTENAYFMFNNALRQIFRYKPMNYTIIAHGNCNVLIKTYTNPELYYRICFRAYIPEVTQRMIKTYNVIRRHDYGFLVPLEAYITDEYVYYRIELIKPLKDHLSYEMTYNLFRKLLPLANYGLAWADYKPSNLGIVNGEPVIIDFECVDKEDIEAVLKPFLEQLRLNRNPKDINKWIRMHKKQCATMNPYRLILLFASIHGRTDPLGVMRLLFNHVLFCIKNNIRYPNFNDDIYDFMMNSPFALL